MTTEWTADDDNQLIGQLTEAQKLLAQFDAASLGDCSLMLWEHRRPGAIAALHAWVQLHGLTVEVDRPRNDGLWAYHAKSTGHHHEILVFSHKEYAA